METPKAMAILTLLAESFIQWLQQVNFHLICAWVGGERQT
jgi:hypothetical protein